MKFYRKKWKRINKITRKKWKKNNFFNGIKKNTDKNVKTQEKYTQIHEKKRKKG